MWANLIEFVRPGLPTIEVPGDLIPVPRVGEDVVLERLYRVRSIRREVVTNGPTPAHCLTHVLLRRLRYVPRSDLRIAWEGGHAARLKGLRPSANPYTKSRLCFAKWLNGYIEAGRGGRTGRGGR